MFYIFWLSRSYLIPVISRNKSKSTTERNMNIRSSVEYRKSISLIESGLRYHMTERVSLSDKWTKSTSADITAKKKVSFVRNRNPYDSRHPIVMIVFLLSRIVTTTWKSDDRVHLSSLLTTRLCIPSSYLLMCLLYVDLCENDFNSDGFTTFILSSWFTSPMNITIPCFYFNTHDNMSSLLEIPWQYHRFGHPTYSCIMMISIMFEASEDFASGIKKKVFCRGVGWRALDENLLRYQMTRMDGLKTPVLKQSTKQNSSAQMTRISVYSEEISFCSKKICHRSRLVSSDLLWNVQTFQFMDDIYTSRKSCPSREGCWIASFSELDFSTFTVTTRNVFELDNFLLIDKEKKIFCFCEERHLFCCHWVRVVPWTYLDPVRYKKDQRLTLSIVKMMTVSITSLW